MHIVQLESGYLLSYEGTQFLTTSFKKNARIFNEQEAILLANIFNGKSVKLDPEPPIMLPDINVKKIQSSVAVYVKTYGTSEFREDFKHYIFEAAVEAFYGKDIWKYLNSLS